MAHRHALIRSRKPPVSGRAPRIAHWTITHADRRAVPRLFRRSTPPPVPARNNGGRLRESAPARSGDSRMEFFKHLQRPEPETAPSPKAVLPRHFAPVAARPWSSATMSMEVNRAEFSDRSTFRPFRQNGYRPSRHGRPEQPGLKIFSRSRGQPGIAVLTCPRMLQRISR